jgi:biotin/methionine sulfoxide reductase
MDNNTTGRWVQNAAHWGAFEAFVEDGRVTDIRPFGEDAHPSPLLQSIPEATHSDLRVDRPYVRRSFLEKTHHSDTTGRGREEFVPVDWQTALDLVADEIRRVRDNFGNEAIYAGSYGWASAGRIHHGKSLLQRFMNQIGGAVVHEGTYSSHAGSTMVPHVAGDSRLVSGPVTEWASIAESCELFVGFGGLPLKNLQVNPGGTGDHPSIAWIEKIRAANVRFVCIGPVRSDGPGGLNVDWLHPRPGTDTAIMMGLAHTLVAENLHDQEFLARCTTGLDRFLPYLMGESDGIAKDADWAAEISGLDADTIRGLARKMAAQRTMINATWSLQRGDHGEQPFWMAIVLAAMLGQMGLPGGGVALGYGSMSRMGNAATAASPAIPLGTNPLRRIIPVARIVDMLLNPGTTIDYNGAKITFPDNKLIYWCGGNPFHHHQDINRLIEGWRRPETIIVQEIFWTATARHADIVLPATTSLERNDIAGGTDSYILAMHQAIDPVGEARNDYDIFADLAERFDVRDTFTEGRDEMGWLRHLYDISRQQAARHGVERPDFDEFWETGYIRQADKVKAFVLFEDFRADPDAHRLMTPSGKIEIYSETVAAFDYDDCPGHPVWMAPAEWLGGAEAGNYPLHIISGQPEQRLHGQHDHGELSLAHKIAGREPVWISTADANARGISQGDVVRVFNDRGECLAGALVTDDIMPGVAQIQTGAWYDPAEPGETGTLDRHGNVNMLTLDKGTSRLSQGPSAQTALVEIEKWLADAPAVGIFNSPVAVPA